MGSDGESDQASGTSSDEVQSPTGVCLRNRIHRRISMEVIHFSYRDHFKLSGELGVALIVCCNWLSSQLTVTNHSAIYFMQRALF